MAGRDEAIQKFAEWHPFLGIELDPTKEVPTVLRLWPARFLHPELSEHEEEAGFRNYLAKRLERLAWRRGALKVSANAIGTGRVLVPGVADWDSVRPRHVCVCECCGQVVFLSDA